MIYKVGIIGTGFGAKAHLPAFAAHRSFEPVAIASPNTAQIVAREHHIAAFRNCRELIEGIDVDVVSVASPPFSHHADVLAALSAGKHVICEKPFALTVRQAQEMVHAAQSSDKATAVMHEFRWVPQRIAIKELVENHHLDPLREIEITHLSSSLTNASRRRNSWWFDRRRGGGIAGALLSHLIDTSNWIAGRPPQRSTGLLRTANAGRRDEDGEFTSTVDDGAFALIDYGSGLVGRLTGDGTAAVESATLAVHGESRTAVASGPDIIDARLFSIDENETSELTCKPSPYARFASAGANVPLIMELLDQFARCIEGKANAVPTFEEALQTQRVLESVGYGA